MSKTPCKRKREKVHPFFKQFQKKRAKKKRKLNRKRIKPKNKNWELGKPVHVQAPDTFEIEKEEFSNRLFEENQMVDDNEEVFSGEDFQGISNSFNTNTSVFSKSNIQFPEDFRRPVMVNFSPSTAKYSRIRQYVLGLEAGLRSIIFFTGDVGTGKSYVMDKLRNILNVHEINDVNIGKSKIRQVFESTQSHGVQNQTTVLLFENVDLFRYGYTASNQLKRLIDDTLTLSKIPIVFIHLPHLARRNRNYLREQLGLDVTITFEFKNLDLYRQRIHGRLPLDNLQQILLKQDLVLEYFHRHCVMNHLTDNNNNNNPNTLQKETFGEYFINMYRKELIPLGCASCNDIRWIINQLFFYGLTKPETSKFFQQQQQESQNLGTHDDKKEEVVNYVQRILGEVFSRVFCIDRLVRNVLTPWAEYGIREVCERDTYIARRKLNFFFLNYIQDKEKFKTQTSKQQPRKRKEEEEEESKISNELFRKKCEFIDLYSELDCGYTKIDPIPHATYGNFEESDNVSFERRMTGSKSMLIQEKNYLLYSSFKHFCSNPSGFETTHDIFSNRPFWRCEESVGLVNGVQVRNRVFEKQRKSFRNRVFNTMMSVLPIRHHLRLEKMPEFVDFVDHVCISEKERRVHVKRKRRFFHFFQSVLSDDDFPVLCFWREEMRKKRREN